MVSSRMLLIITVGLVSKNLATAQELEVDVQEVRHLVSEWNKAHTISTVGTLSSLYSDTVDFYGSNPTRRRTCIATMKRAMLEKQKGLCASALSNENWFYLDTSKMGSFGATL